jgi:hypothetical protein
MERSAVGATLAAYMRSPWANMGGSPREEFLVQHEKRVGDQIVRERKPPPPKGK